MRRSKIAYVTATVAAAGLALAACGSGSSGAETDGDTTGEEGGQGSNELVIYASHPTEMVDYFVEAFEEENSGLKVELITGGTGDLLSRVQAEEGRPQGDILWGGSSTTGGSKPDLFVKYDSDVLGEIDDAFLDPNGYNAPSDAFTMVILYNKNLVDEADAPTSWEDLTDPKWKGKVRFANPESSSSSYAALVNWLLIGDWDLVEGLAENMIIDDSSSAPFTAVGQGEAEVAVAYEEGAYRWLESGEVEIVYPEDGVVVLPGGLFQIADGPNPDNAKAFADFVLSAEQQQALVDNFPGRRPTNVEVELPDTMPSAAELNVLDYASADAEEHQDEWLSQWRDIMINTR